MTRVVPLLCLACAVAIGGTAYVLVGATANDHLGIPANAAAALEPAPSGLADALRAARRTCRLEPLDDVVGQLRAATAASSAQPGDWQLLAKALLERCLQRTHLRGIVVGAPTFTELPPEMSRDIDDGLAAAAKAHELGQENGDLYRIEAGLMSLRITGLGSALQWGSKVQQALQKSGKLDAGNPHLHVASGLRKLLAPKLLGQDIARALEHFEFAAKALTDDERPAVFAAMASYLLKKRMQAIDWLQQAVQRNPNNTFARVVLQRLHRGEDDAFARDVTAAEVAAMK